MQPLAPHPPKTTKLDLAIHILEFLHALGRPPEMVKLRVIVAMAAFTQPESAHTIGKAAHLTKDRSMTSYMKSALRSGLVDAHTPSAGKARTKYVLNDEGRAFVRDLLTPRLSASSDASRAASGSS